MHWNLNSFKTSNFYRKTVIETFNLAMNYDVIAISESALHSDTENNDLLLNGYIPFQRDLPDDRQYGGILVYVKNYIACQGRQDLETTTDQLILELTVDNKSVLSAQTIENIIIMMKRNFLYIWIISHNRVKIFVHKIPFVLCTLVTSIATIQLG